MLHFVVSKNAVCCSVLLGLTLNQINKKIEKSCINFIEVWVEKARTTSLGTLILGAFPEIF
jgi:hypothetical protein